MVYIGYVMIKIEDEPRMKFLVYPQKLPRSMFCVCLKGRIILLTSSDIKIFFIMAERASQCPNRDDPRAKKMTGKTQCNAKFPMDALNSQQRTEVFRFSFSSAEADFKKRKQSAHSDPQDLQYYKCKPCFLIYPCFCMVNFSKGGYPLF